MEHETKKIKINTDISRNQSDIKKQIATFFFKLNQNCNSLKRKEKF